VRQVRVDGHTWEDSQEDSVLRAATADLVRGCAINSSAQNTNLNTKIAGVEFVEYMVGATSSDDFSSSQYELVASCFWRHDHIR